MNSEVAVVCFLWGDWPITTGKVVGSSNSFLISDLAETYIHHLFSGLKNNTLLNSDFIVITDKFGIKKSVQEDLGIKKIIHIPHGWKSMRWNLKKSFVFDPSCALENYGWVVLMDLDLVVTGNLDFLLSHRSSGLVTCKGAFTNRLGGSVLGFSPKECWPGDIAKRLKCDISHFERVTKGSERKLLSIMSRKGVIPKVEFWQDLYPRSIASYKVDGETEDFRLVRFHGLPRPHQLTSDWIRKYWR